MKAINQYISEARAQDEIIIVTGMSGSGKTTYSEGLAKEEKYHIIHLDDIAKEIMFKKFNIKSSEDSKRWKEEHTVQELIKEIDESQIKALKWALKNAKPHTIIEGTGPYKVKSLALKYDIHAMKIISLQETLKRKINRRKKQGKENNSPIIRRN